MSPQQFQLIRQSFAQVETIAPLATSLFYGRLFELAPDIRALFRYDLGSRGMAQQGMKLIEALALVVQHLDDLPIIAPQIQALGRRHTNYGVQPHHYQAVASALLWTLEQGLGEAFTPEVHQAWEWLYTWVSQTMQADSSLYPVNAASFTR